MKKKIAFGLLLVVILFPLLKIGWQKREYYLAPFDPGEAKRAYEISQYVLTEKASWIPDELHFSYASWDYINGGNPILVNPDYPPLGKYLVGLSQKFLDNERIPTLFFALLSLYSFYLISSLFFENKLIALIPLLFLSWERLFQEQLLYLPLFEIFALAFFNLSFYFFIKAEKKEVYFLVSSFFLGVLWGVKPWMLTIPLLASWFVYLALKKDFRRLILWLFSLLVAVMVIVLSYFRLFVEGWGVYKVLSVQKWILWYHRSKLTKFGSVWPFIYLKRWYVWWGDEPYLAVDQWSIFWPVFTSLSLVLSALVLLKSFKVKVNWFKKIRFDSRIMVVCLWVIFDLLFLSVGNTNVRYIFYLLPFVYLLGVYFLISVGRGKIKLWE